MLIVGIENARSLLYAIFENLIENITITTPYPEPNPNVTVWLA